MLKDLYPTGRTVYFTHGPNGKVASMARRAYADTEVVTLLYEMHHRPFGGLTGMRTGYNDEVDVQSGECGCIEGVNPGRAMEQSYSFVSNGNLTEIAAPNLPRQQP